MSILYLRSLDGGKDKAVELVLWASVLASWFFYMVLNGSNPGYLTKKFDDEEASVPATLNGQQKSPTFVEPGDGQNSDTSAPEISGEIEIELSSSPAAFKTGLHQRSTPTSSDASHRDSDQLHPSLNNNGNEEESVRFAGGEDKEELYIEHGSLLGSDSTDYNPDLSGSIANAIIDASRGFRRCKWCDMRQLSRAHHCRECNACVATFDHHCTMINTCIGENNRARFLGFITTQVSYRKMSRNNSV